MQFTAGNQLKLCSCLWDYDNLEKDISTWHSTACPTWCDTDR